MNCVATTEEGVGVQVVEQKKLQHVKQALIKKTGKFRTQTPYIYLSREALDELNWELDKWLQVEYDVVNSCITIRES